MTNTPAADRLIIDADAASFNSDAEDAFDPFADDIIDRRSTELSPEGFRAWCAAFDICPIHLTDIEICLDDDLGCAVHGCDCPTIDACAEAGDLDPATLPGDEPYDEADNA
jgi:hypothetical protein